MRFPVASVEHLRTSMSSKTRTLLSSGVVWDNHACMPLRADGEFLPQLERYRSAGVDVVSLNIGFADISWSEHLRILSYMRWWLTQRSDSYRLVSAIEDVHHCKATGKLGITFDIEGMGPVQRDLSLIQTFYELGVRWMLIAYNRNNEAGGGCLDVDRGLTKIGRAIIDEMERVGMVLCLSHTGPRTADEALAYSRKPVIFSHSNPSGMVAHPRNISDRLIAGCASKGGVVGLSGFGPFLGAASKLGDALLRQLYYVIDLVGPAHVGIGLDYVFDKSEMVSHVTENRGLYPPGFDEPAKIEMLGPEAFVEIAEDLGRRNFSDEDIHRILGGNWLRVASRVWR